MTVPNAAQRALLEHYPDMDLLVLPEKPEEIGDFVKDQNCGDSLFRFLWIELEEGDNPYQSVQRAIEDLQGLLEHMPESNQEPDVSPSP